MINPKQRPKFKWGSLIWIVFITLFLLFLVMPSGNAWLFEVPVRFVAGWFWFVDQNVRLIEWDVQRCLTAFVSAAIAVACLHGVIAALRKRVRPDLAAWRWRWTGGLALLLLALGLAGIAVTAMASQVVWLVREPKVQAVGFSDGMRNLSHARQLLMLVQAFAEEHEGRYPDDLLEAALWQSDPTDFPFQSKLYFFRADREATPEHWLYFGQGLREPVPPKTILLASPRTVKGKRVVAQASGEVSFVDEARFTKMLEARK
jgi:hypothetical protein